MSFVFDIIIAAVIALSLYFGFKKGFIRAIMNLISFAAALIMSILFTDTAAEAIYKTKIFGSFTDSVSDSIRSMISSGGDAGVEKLFSDKPPAFIGILDRFGANVSDIETKYREGVANGLTDTTDTIAEYLTEPVVRALSSIIAFILIFIITMIVAKLLLLMLDKFCKLPGLKAANRILGLVLGGISGLLYAWIIAMVFSMALPYLSQLSPDLFATNIIENSFILNLMATNNPLGWLGKLF